MLIGLCGYAQAGKDTVANILVEEFGFTRLAFADVLKNVLQDINPWVDRFRLGPYLAGGWENAKRIDEVRRLLQALGVACREHLYPNVWVDAVMRQIGTGQAWHKDWVISDVRFPNEIHAIEARGGELWRIDRPGVGPANGHISEHAWNDAQFDHVVWNGDSLEVLKGRVISRVEQAPGRTRTALRR